MKLSHISLIAEELFPFVHYLSRSHRQLRRCSVENILNNKGFSDYETLPKDQLERRLKEERQRASAMDEKTFKLTLSLSVSLTVLGSMAAFVTNAISSATVQATLTILFGVGLFYALAAGFTAVGALRTQRTYGYGTAFLLEQQREQDAPRILADALARQETMNIVRHLRNETAYQALRNGLLMLFAGILIFSVTLTYQSLRPLPTSQTAHVQDSIGSTPPTQAYRPLEHHRLQRAGGQAEVEGLPGAGHAEVEAPARPAELPRIRRPRGADTPDKPGVRVAPEAGQKQGGPHHQLAEP